MIVPAYTPGSWWFAVADGGFVALPGDVEAATLTEIWSALREGAGLTDLLTGLLRPGLSAVPPFALVDVEGGTVHAVVRGDVVVAVDTAAGPRTVSGAQMTTWTESVLADARRVVVRTPGAADPDPRLAVPVLSGVVRAGSLVVELRADRPAPRAAEPTPLAEPAPVVGPPARRDACASGDPCSPVPAVPAGAVAPAAPPQDDEQHDTRPSWAPVHPVPAEPLGGPSGGSWFEESSGDLLTGEHLSAATAPQRLVAPAPDRPADAHPVSPADHGPDDAEDGGHGEDHDGLTVLSSDVVALRRQLPEWAGDAVPSLAVPTPRNPAPAKLVLSTGLVVSLNRPVLLGRAPQVTRVANNEIPRLVTLASPNQDISRTHAEVRMDGEDVVVTDLRSTNGVLLLRQGAGPQRLHPGEPTVVEPGVVVDLGEGATFLVEAGG